MKIVCISDTHGDHEQVSLPQGDVLLHAGDVTAHGTEQDLRAFVDWFSRQPFEHKIFIAGNHDRYIEAEVDVVKQLCTEKSVAYLDDSGIDIDGIRFWGSPITPRFFDWSFMREPGDDINKHWRLIPDDTQVLITHGPVWGVLDEVERSDVFTEHTGCPSLKERVLSVQPEYHIFGHIHEGYGKVVDGKTTYLNVSTMDKGYRIHNAPVVIELGS